MTAQIAVLMGVTGCGKSTVGQALARAHGWAFQDADDLHPQVNIAKMSRGDPLTDADREPWLAAVRQCIVDFREPAVVACSALKEAHRRAIVMEDQHITVVYLCGSHGLISRRLDNRTSHFMPPRLLQSQFDDLEEPMGAITVSIDQSVAAIVLEISKQLRVSERTTP